jgi:hypothetical protein
MSLFELAYHEAGHAVAAYDLGLLIEEVAINRDGGYCKLRRPAWRDDIPAWLDDISRLFVSNAPHEVRILSNAPHEVRSYIKNKIVTLLSGPNAMNLYSHGAFRKLYYTMSNTRDEGCDMVQVLKQLLLFTPRKKCAEAFGGRMQIRSMMLVKRRWKDIESIAKILLEERTIDGRRVKETLDFVKVIDFI